MKYGAILLILLLSFELVQAQEECTLKKDSEGVKVYLCDNDERPFKTIIVELEVPATLAQYTAKVLDVKNYYRWQDRVSKQEVLEQMSATEFYYYSEVDVPWPVADRDYIFHLKLEQNPNSKVVTMSLTEIPEYIPVKEDIIRVPYAQSLLTLTPIDKSNIKVRYVLDVDPGGEVPAWLINIFAANTPWNVYYNFRQQIIDQGDNRKEVDFILNY